MRFTFLIPHRKVNWRQWILLVVFSASQHRRSCEDEEASRTESLSKFNICIGWINSFLKIGNHSRLDWWVCSGRVVNVNNGISLVNFIKLWLCLQQVLVWRFSLEVTLAIRWSKQATLQKTPFWSFLEVWNSLKPLCQSLPLPLKVIDHAHHSPTNHLTVSDP